MSTPIQHGRPHIEEPTKTVLLVEDDRATQSFLNRGLKGLNGFRVLLAGHGQEALDILTREEVNVLVTDLQMPVLDGYQLIGEVSARYPHIPIIVVTSTPPEEHGYAPFRLGAMSLFAKPPRLSALMDEIRNAAALPADAAIRGLSLASLLQLLQWERKSCTLVVRAQQGLGLLYIQEGALIHGAFRDMEGLKAVFEILGWEDIHVEMVSTCRVEATVSDPLEELLMDAAVARDHKKAQALAEEGGLP